MSEQASQHDRPPTALKVAGLAVLGLVLAGAFYLVWARGEAITLDLATLAGKVWCF